MEFTIEDAFDGVRLDTFLKKTYQEIPSAGIFKMVRKGNVKVNKKRKKIHYRLQRGDRVRVWEASSPTAPKSMLQLSPAQHEGIADSVVFENQDLLLYNKEAGIVMHAGSKHEHGLAEMLYAYTRNPHFSFVHRIDKMTSGLVLGAKNLVSTRHLSGLIRERGIRKIYLVLVEGNIEKENFEIRNYLKKEADRVRIYENSDSGAKEAISSFWVLKRGPTRCLLQAELHTGRTHQLRVQLAAIGHPIVGDRKYGLPSAASAEQMFLFSQRMVITSLSLDLALPVPPLFQDALRK